jgi:hypothetical protein
MGLLKPEDWTAGWIGLDGNEPPVEGGKIVEATPRPPQNLKIFKATYAARDGAGSADVTEKVASLVKDGVLDLKAAGELGGDPAPNHVKELTVEFEFDGVRDTPK